MDVVRADSDDTGSIWTYSGVGFIRQVVAKNFGVVGQDIHYSHKLGITKAWGGAALTFRGIAQISQPNQRLGSFWQGVNERKCTCGIGFTAVDVE